MPTFPPTVDFKHKVTWTIKNFNLLSTHIIRSPEFDFRCLDVTTWSLDLYPNWFTGVRNMQLAVRLHYLRSRDTAELHIMSVKYVIYVVDRIGSKRFQTEGFFSPTFEVPASLPMNFIPQLEFEGDSLLTKGALVVGCELTTKVNQVEFMASVYDDEMVSLSGRLSEMLGHPTHTDMVAFSKDTVSFDLHKCIMKARCPILFRDSPDPIIQTPFKLIWSSSISTQVLRALLFYIYGRMTIPLQNCNKAELLSLAVLYKLSDLEKKLTEYPDDLAITTEKQMEIIYNYSLDNFLWVVDDNTSFEIEYPDPTTVTKHLLKTKLVLSFKVMEASGDAEAYIKIGFKVSEIDPQVPILLKCTLYLLEEDRSVLGSEQHSHTFRNDEEWSPPPFLTRTSLQLPRPHSPRILRLKALLTEACVRGLVWSNVHRVETGRCILFNNFLLVADDLLMLYMNHLNCDLKIKIQKFEFLGHRSFLMKRSLTIRRHLEKLESGEAEERSDMVEIRLNNVEGDICHMVMLYMYSGRIDIKDSETAKRLGRAASYFQLPFLVDKCFFFKSG